MIIMIIITKMEIVKRVLWPRVAKKASMGSISMS